MTTKIEKVQLVVINGLPKTTILRTILTDNTEIIPGFFEITDDPVSTFVVCQQSLGITKDIGYKLDKPNSEIHFSQELLLDDIQYRTQYFITRL